MFLAAFSSRSRISPQYRADMGTDGETLLDPFPTAATVLGRIRWRDRFHSLAGPFCLAGEDHAEAGPPSVLNRLVEASLCAGPVVLIAALAVRLRCQDDDSSC